MVGRQSVRFVFVGVAMFLALLWVSAAAVSANGGTTTGDGGPGEGPPCAALDEFERGDFPGVPKIDNKFLPFVPGTQLVLEGRANRGGGPLPHTVTFTVTDLTKVLDGVRTAVIWDVDENEGEVVESELSFFAQDDDGNVWNLGEYPEEFEGGVFVGAPSVWISGIADAQAGIHMGGRPRVSDLLYLQGFAPEIDFLDCAQVIEKRQETCVPFRCFDDVLITEESNPLDPEGGSQLKYHAPGVGIVQVGAVDDPEGETLVLIDHRKLSPGELAQARNEALKLDKHGYEVSEVYAETPRIERPKKAEGPRYDERRRKAERSRKKHRSHDGDRRGHRRGSDRDDRND